MNKYKISKNVDVEKSTSAMNIPALSKNLIAAGIMVFPLVAHPVAGVMLLNELADKDVKEITSLEELDKFSCVDTEWKTDCIYVEHPRIPKRLIEAKLYKDYILKELMSEIFDYITDNISVKKIVLGLESKNKVKAGVSVPINELVVDAQLAGSINNNYLCSMEDVECTNEKDKEYPWLSYYPDIVAAVKKNAGKLEIKQCIKMDLDVSLGIQGAIKGAFGAEQEYNFYVYYTQA